MTLIPADSEGNRCEGGNAGRGRAKVRFDNGTYTSLPVDQVEMVDEAPRGVLAGPRCCP